VLAEDAVLYSDGGGKRRAALNPIVGKARILRFLEVGARKGTVFVASAFARVSLNGLPGFVFQTREGTETLALEVADGRITALYSIRNPDKLGHLAGPAA
jgi:RNA polymerase sigma-70 factor (ECF subfamily)